MKKLLLKRSGLRFVAVAVLLLSLACAAVLTSSYVSTKKKSLKSDIDLPIITLKAQKITDTLEALTDMAFPRTGEMWVCKQNGVILKFKDGKQSNVPVLDLRSKTIKINNGYEERGLLGIALHPDFKKNGKFYVFYSRPIEKKGFNHTGVVAEYRSTQSGSVDPNSGRVILAVDEPDGNHNGGCLKFGPDGYLYVSFGDGGGQHDKHGPIGNGQNMNTLLGKILRIDVNTDSGYKVPADNPFVDSADVKPEIWAYGFRNPYRMSFDKVTKQLFVGEVGQDLWEEVDIVKKGANYGWKIMEGTHCHNDENKPDDGCDIKGLTMPIDEYSHKIGISIMGGYVYNGTEIPALKSNYFFADWTGPMFYLKQNGTKWNRGNVKLANFPENLKITGINEDENGELYLLTNPDTGPGNKKCGIFKIVKN
ncbi:glucose/arabinose dehydrogenase [Pedobacter sp. UYEF25]